MEKTISATQTALTISKLYNWATGLAIITIFYNVVEGVISVVLGLEDETIALWGFGLDSFVEVISGIGILHMVLRLKNNHSENPDQFERTALRITGTAFYLLALGLGVTSIINLFQGNAPQTTFWGIVIALISIITMWLLIRFKIKVGEGLRSQAIIADANCTRACMYLSFTLLISSIAYELTGLGHIDALGALAIGGFALKEGHETFAQAKGLACGCDG